MEGTIVNFRKGRHTQTTNQMVIEVGGVDNREKAAKLVGKKVTFTTPAGKKITGEVRGAHGNSGAIRVLFEKGMPGQSLTKKVSLD